MKRIRILHIVQCAGGVERYIQMLLSNMDKNIFEHILVCSHDYHAEQYRDLAAAFIHVDFGREISLGRDFAAMRCIRRILHQYRPDVVYMHSSKAGAVGRLANIGLKNISVYNPHGWAFNMSCGKGKRTLYEMIERLFAPLCTKIIAISDFEKKSALQRKICGEKKMQVIFNGIDVEKYQSSWETYQSVRRSDYGIPENAVVIGCVGRVTRQKSPDVFVEAACMIKKALPAAYFVMVGDGDQEDNIRKLVKEKQLNDCFLMTGWVDDPMKYICTFDAAALLSRWEGFGLAIAEYMLARKPIVATRVDAIPDLITHEHNGLLVPSDDPEAACKAVLRILEDRTLKQTMQENGYQTVVTRFDVKRVARETQNMLRALVKNQA